MTKSVEIIWNYNLDEAKKYPYVILACKNPEGKKAITEAYNANGVWYASDNSKIDVEYSTPYAFTVLEAPSF